MTLTKQYIAHMLETNETWLCRGVLAIYGHQTDDEQNAEHTKYYNNWGFRPADAKFLSSIAKNIQKGWKLSDKQLYVTRKRMAKYAGQLLKIAKKNLEK